MRARHVHIVMGGGRDEHVAVGLSVLECDSFHVITSTEYASQYESRMPKWAKEIGVEKGLLIAIPTEELFSESAAESVRAAVQSICDVEGERFPLMMGNDERGGDGEGIPCRFLVNITGGTNLMSGAAVHAAGTIGATCYYVKQGRGSEDDFPIIFPSMGITSLLSKHNAVPMKELLGKPTGFVVDLKHAGSLVLDLCKFGFATIQEEGMHYEISEEAKRLMFQTVQNRREEDVVTDAINDLTKRFKDRNKKKKDEKFLHNLVNLPHEECSDQILRAVLESKNLEGRAEVWEGKEGTRLRLYFAFYGEEAGGKSWDPKGDSSIHGLSETWNDEDGAVGFLLHFASHPRLQNQKIQGDFARVLSGDSEMEKFAMYARLHYWYLKFKLLGSTGGPVKN